MNVFASLKTSGVVFFLCALTAISAQSQSFQVLLTFDRQNGGLTEYVTPTQGADGYIFGTSSGVVFRGLPGGQFRDITLCTEPVCTEGGNFPWAGVILSTGGNFYGTTGDGGKYGQGAIFKLGYDATLTTVYSFCQLAGCPDGSLPQAGLTEGTDGNLYGTTATGGTGCGTGGCGTIFTIDTKGQLTTLYKFCQQTNCADGEVPHGTLLQATDGNFYGITSSGGNGTFDGVVFRISPSGSFSVVYKFCSLGGCTDGNYPFGGLIQGTDGNLYGTTSSGGEHNQGTVFKMTLGGTLTTLYSFCSQASCADGAAPFGELVQGNDGNFYGTTTELGANMGGTIFELTPGSAETTLYTFCSQAKCADGSTPFGGLLQRTDGNFYGLTSFGGVFGGVGTAFSLSTGLGPFVAFVQRSGQIGQTAQILGQGFTGTTGVSFNGVPAAFTVKSDTFLTATVPGGANTGYVTVSTSNGTLTSNVPFQIIP